MTDPERTHPYGFNGTQEQLLRALRYHPKRESASTRAVKEAAAWEIERLAAARREGASMTYTEAQQRELDLRASAAEDRRMEHIPADYYDFPYDGHAIWHPTWGLRLQCDDQGYALLSASEARRFAEWLRDATRHVPLPQGEELADG